MVAGFQAWTDTGFIQIDQDFRNPALITSGTINGPAAITYEDATTPILVLSASYPNHVSFWYGVRVGSDILFYVDGNGSYRIYDAPPTPPAHGVGLQVFRSDGSVAFDSNYPYLRPVAAANLARSAASDGAAIGGVTIPAGKDYGWIVNNPGYWLDNGVPVGGQRSQGVWSIGENSAGTGFVTHRKTLQQFGGELPPDEYTNLQLTFVDLTDT